MPKRTAQGIKYPNVYSFLKKVMKDNKILKQFREVFPEPKLRNQIYLQIFSNSGFSEERVINFTKIKMIKEVFPTKEFDDDFYLSIWDKFSGIEKVKSELEKVVVNWTNTL